MPGYRPRPGQRRRVPPERLEPAAPAVARGGERELLAQVGQAGDCRGCATARSRWPGSRRRAGSPGCGTSPRSGPPRWPRGSSRPGWPRRRSGTGDSPFRPNIACSRSACSVLVGIPVDGPGPLDVADDQRQLDRHGQADGLGLQQHAGPGGGRSRPASRRRTAPRAAPTAADLVLGLERADPEALVLGQLVQDVRGRRDRVGAEEQRQPGQLRRGDEPVGQRGVAADVPVGARASAARA